jgi:lipopolysaccharide/colanic/teichoic acid biosynthesis glycosyltransferase
MLKRIFDIIIASLGLMVASPILAIFIFLIWIQDYKNPLYFGERVGLNKIVFKMVKIRSMVIDADKSGVESTSLSDGRITRIGLLIRKFKIDELSQLWNVLVGEMSLVGPRPNTINEVAKYSDNERKLLTIKPGITDISSIIFSDEGEILKGESNAEIAYDTLIWPWKSKFGLIYVNNNNILLDLCLIFITIICIFSRRLGLNLIQKLLIFFKTDDLLIKVASRNYSLKDFNK